ncbi:toxin-antitoxin system YwqK family antitoxin [Winogradskyella alexanderae]|uniref:Toxin-antitoxin system YwqK family antitoxin n=1 Tax=Winogradskyella alexanderae TaxID=2877123 RepID=A0ABS7XPU6_9FLAO|nr:toxin-antitoxin system YwqK family antitoxin [Winogradskyella alexanderae]MCA0132020.1 toxin-antitoxin system YwqK family antitoxin [Winogradskyella alexanderae]
MIKQTIIFTLIFTITLTTCLGQQSVNQYDKNGERHGYWTKNYDGTDQKRYEGNFINGKEVGTFKFYKLKDGKSVLSATKEFNESDDIAKVTFYTSAKKIVSHGKMIRKNFIGKWIYYHNNSDAIMIEEHYNDKGLLDGKRLVYYENGNIAEDTYYKNGKLNGEAQWYTKAKQYIRTVEYLNGERHGQTINYDGKGNRASEGMFQKDQKVGVWKYYKDGVLSKEIDHTINKVVYDKD